MIVNTGISLRKPGESLYARFRRFLIANQGIYTNYSSSRNALVKFGESKFGKSMSGLSSIEVLTKIEEKIIESNLLDKFQRTDPISFHPKSIKNCDECAKIGFHSEIYNLIWVTKCPIHNLDLSSCCGSCDQIWPAVSNLFKTDCETCGVKIPFDLLSQRRAFDINRKFDSFADIVEFNYQALTPETCSIKEYFGAYSGNHSDYRSEYTTLRSSFTPSALLERPGKASWTRKKLEKLGIKTYPAVTLSFPVLKHAINDSQQLTNSDTWKILQRVKIRILNAIYETHKASGKANTICSYSEFRNRGSCAACKAWHYFNGAEVLQSVERKETNSSYKILEAYWYVESQLIERRVLPRPTYPNKSLSRHISLEGNLSSNFEAANAIQIPHHVIKWMYYSELLICYLHAYFQLVYIEECEYQNRTALIDILAYAPKSLKYYGLLSNPYHISTHEGLVWITTPKVLLQPQQALCNKFMTS